jgi:uncharacterized membrane protein YhaH (DUF805 family)
MAVSNRQMNDSMVKQVIFLSVLIPLGLLILGCIPGQRGPNKYGDPPD